MQPWGQPHPQPQPQQTVAQHNTAFWHNAQAAMGAGGAGWVPLAGGHNPSWSAPPVMMGQSTVSSAVLAENELARLPRGRRAARARHARRERAAYIARGASERG